MTDTFLDPSEKALAVIEAKAKWTDKYDHLFDLCPAGKSFMVELTDVSINTLRPFTSKYGKMNNKVFTVVKHDNCYEVYRKE